MFSWTIVFAVITFTLVCKHFYPAKQTKAKQSSDVQRVDSYSQTPLPLQSEEDSETCSSYMLSDEDMTSDEEDDLEETQDPTVSVSLSCGIGSETRLDGETVDEANRITREQITTLHRRRKSH